MENLSVLITGGAGFIGSHIARYLINHNVKFVRILDNLSTGSMNNINDLITKNNFDFQWGDITNENTCIKACESINIICHQAALGSVPISILDPLTNHNTNVNGFLNILLAAKKNNIDRVIYASSSAVYGDDNMAIKNENVIGVSLSPYAVTKRINELYGKIFTDIYKLKTIGLRYFNVYGPNQSLNSVYSAVIPKFIDDLLCDRRPIIYGTGLNSRDFVYIDNVVYANVLAMLTNNTDCFGNVFNIATEEKTTINNLINNLKKIINKDIEPIYIDNRIGDIIESVGSIEKSKKLLNYNIIVSMSEGLHNTVAYYKNHKQK